MLPLTVLLVLVAVLYFIYRRYYVRPSIVADIPGPEPGSFLLGNLKQLFQSDAGEREFEWQNRFGGIARIKAPFGEDRLWISDPKALYHICQASGYNYCRPTEQRELARLIADEGVLWAEGDVHKRQKRVILPAFGAASTKPLFPFFCEVGANLAAKWKDIIINDQNDMGQSSVIDVISWLGRATLDAIGQAGFDYDFKAVNGYQGPVERSYKNFMKIASGNPTALKILVESTFQYIPKWLLTFLINTISGEAVRVADQNRKLVHKLAHELIKDKSDAFVTGKSKRDVLSLLINANMSEDENKRLSQHDIISQTRTMILGGYETTTNTLSFLLLELAKHPEVQVRIRQEIQEIKSSKVNQGEHLDVNDLGKMPYMNAVIKEALRMHPIVYHLLRFAGKDDVLPLSKPIVTRSGKKITEIPISKGTRVILSLAAYNRNKTIWGDDADIFNPDRWLTTVKSKDGAAVGVYSNLLSFSAGVRACLGWRFGLLELQAFTIELLSNFEFGMTEESEKVRRMACTVMMPVIRGQEDKGVQCPLKVSIVTN